MDITSRLNTLHLEKNKQWTLIGVSISFYLLFLPLMHFPWTTLVKPIPLILLIQLVWQTGRRKALLSALSFSVAGDIILTWPGPMALYGGMFAFMLAHSSYIRLFLSNFKLSRLNLKPFLLYAVVIIYFYYLWPHINGMKIPLLIYSFLLTLMVICAFQEKHHRAIPGGAVSFFISDGLLAWNLFVFQEARWMEVAIMFFYYLGQTLLVLGIIGKNLFFPEPLRAHPSSVQP